MKCFHTFPMLFLLGVSLWLAGCSQGEEGPKMYPVSGTVKLDGMELKTGQIRFFSEDGTSIQSAEIVDGKYELEATEGTKKVEIDSRQEQGTAPDGLPNYVNLVPAQFNTQTTLKETVKAEEENTINFDLKTK